MHKAVCFGEILWDLFPEGKQIGGAPFNVAKQLSNFGMHCDFISAVGNDSLGEELMNILGETNISKEQLQIKTELPTGKVEVILDEKGSASYTIFEPVAWDAIKIKQEHKNLVSNSDVFIYGSLAARSKISRDTLFQVLKSARFKVFDVNLRPPHFTLKNLTGLLGEANLIKMNDDEINLICNKLAFKKNGIEDRMLFLAEKFNAGSVAVTLGSKGALLLHGGQFYESKSYSVKVQDTVGAGDAFLAALLSKLLLTNKPEASLNFACAVGALVASKTGANPEISEQEITRMLREE